MVFATKNVEWTLLSAAFDFAETGRTPVSALYFYDDRVGRAFLLAGGRRFAAANPT